jgi:hypothetical protein
LIVTRTACFHKEPSVDRWRVIEMRDLSSDLFDGTLIVERIPTALA